MDGVAESAPRRTLVVIDRLHGELNVYVSDPRDTLVVLVEGDVDDEGNPDCSVEAHRGIDGIPDDIRDRVVKVLEAQMAPEPAA